MITKNVRSLWLGVGNNLSGVRLINVSGNIVTTTERSYLSSVVERWNNTTNYFSDLRKNFAESVSHNNMYQQLYLGADGTAATPDDYTLGSVYDVDVLYPVSISIKPMYLDGDSDYKYTITETFENISDETVEINEIGLFTKRAGVFMWARETFETIKMKPGEIRAFTMTLE